MSFSAGTRRKWGDIEMYRKPSQKVCDRLYRQYYNRIVDILRTGADFNVGNDFKDDALRLVIRDMHNDNRDLDKISICCIACREAKQDEYALAVKHHPTWHKAVLDGEGWTTCLRAWRADGGMEYLKYMEHKEAR